MTTQRPGFDMLFMDTAYLMARRATCDRKHVGCVITVGVHIVATGYNGSPSKTPHCDDEGHIIEERYGSRCIRTAHAEANAVATAAKLGHKTDGGTAYVTCTPCYDCAKLLIAAGIKRVVFNEHYRGGSEDLLMQAGVTLDQMPINYVNPE